MISLQYILVSICLEGKNAFGVHACNLFKVAVSIRIESLDFQKSHVTARSDYFGGVREFRAGVPGAPLSVCLGTSQAQAVLIFLGKNPGAAS